MSPCSSIAVLDRERTTVSLLHYSVARAKVRGKEAAMGIGESKE